MEASKIPSAQYAYLDFINGSIRSKQETVLIKADSLDKK